MEKAKSIQPANGESDVLRRTGLSADQYLDLKSRLTRLLNCSFQNSYGISTGHEFNVIGAINASNTLSFIVLDNRHRLDRIDKDKVPPVLGLFRGENSIMIDMVKAAQHFELRYNERMEFLDVKNWLYFGLMVATVPLRIPVSDSSE